MHAIAGDKRRMQIWKINASLLRIKDPEIKRKQWVADKPQTSSLKFIVLYCLGPWSLLIMRHLISKMTLYPDR